MKPENFRILNQRRRCCLRVLFVFLSAGAFIQLITGCGFPKYPSNLPTPAAVDSDSCPHIAGHYSDKGEVFTTKGKPAGIVSLSQLLHNNDPCFAQADSIIVEGPEQGLLEINSLVAGRPYASWWVNLPGQSRICRCEKGFVAIYGVTVKDSRIGIAGYGGGRCNLMFKQSIDGSLIALDKTLYAGSFAWIVPYFYEKCLWYRFPPVTQGVLNRTSQNSEQIISPDLRGKNADMSRF